MLTETKVREHLEWLRVHCQRYTHEQRDATIAQFVTLLWVLGEDPAAARGKAETYWDESRDERWRGS